MTTVGKIAEVISKRIQDEKECFIAMWVRQNPNEDLNDWKLCYQPCYYGRGVGTKFWMEKK